MAEEIKKAKEEVDEVLKTTEVLKKIVESIDDSFESISKRINASLISLQSARETTSSLVKNYKALDNNIGKLLSDEKEINRLTLSQIRSTTNKVNLLKIQAEIQAESLLNEKGLLAVEKGFFDIRRKINEQLDHGMKLEEEAMLEQYKKYGITLEQARALNSISDKEAEILQAILDENGAYISTLELLQKREKEEIKFQSAMGITGGILDNISRIGFRAFGGLGVNLAALGVSFDQASKDMTKLSDAFAKGDYQAAQTEGFKGSREEFDRLAASLEEGGNRADRLRVRTLALTRGFTGIKNTISEAFTDPITRMGMLISFTGTMIDKFKAIDQIRTEMERLGGAAATANLETAASGMNLVTFTQIAKIATGLTQQLGVNVGLAFSKENLERAALLENYLGLSSEEAGNLATLSQAFGTNLNENKNSLIAGVNSFNAMNKAAISHSTIIRDVASTSKAVAASLEGNPEKLAKAAAAARLLGVQLNELDNIASSLLDFESSIESELEAQLLTGKNINLTKARELALSNDLEGVGRELFNNSASLFEFGRMNRIQQESYAKALGLSREQLAGVAYQQAISQRLTGQALQDATGMTAAELERMSINERLVKTQEKLADLAGKYGIYIAGALIGIQTISALTSTIVAVDTIRTILAAKRAKSEAASAAASLLEAKADAVSSAADAGSSIAKIPGVGGFLALGVITSIAGYLLGKLTSIQDGIIDPNGGPVIKPFPKGTLTAQIDKDDSIVVGTNLKGAGTSNDVTNQLLERLIIATEKRQKQNIYLGHAYKLNEGLELYV